MDFGTPSSLAISRRERPSERSLTTVPLYYENRGDKIKEIKNPDITDKILDAIEEADLNPDQAEKVMHEFEKEVHLLTAEPRLRAIAKDFVGHYSDLWTTGNDIMQDVRDQTDAIQAIFREMQKKRKHIDTTDLMVEINHIINENVEIEHQEGDGLVESRRFDISQIDFDLLAAEFAKVKRKNLMIKDLNDLVQERLSKMMAVNPSRVDYYVRYMGIIETYNAEQDRSTIEKTFMELMDLAKSMSEEEQRYAREGFSSDEELSIYDLLFSDNLSKSDIDKIKKMSKDLLQKIKDRIAGMDHWTDKQKTRAAVDILFRNVHYEEIPDSMFDRLEAYRKAIYEHIYTHYKQVA